MALSGQPISNEPHRCFSFRAWCCDGSPSGQPVGGPRLAISASISGVISDSSCDSCQSDQRFGRFALMWITSIRRPPGTRQAKGRPQSLESNILARDGAEPTGSLHHVILIEKSLMWASIEPAGKGECAGKASIQPHSRSAKKPNNG
jgi:hypothetical protein